MHLIEKLCFPCQAMSACLLCPVSGTSLRKVNDQEGYITVLKKDDSYVPFNVTQHYTLGLKELENEILYEYIDTYYITGQILKTWKAT